MSEPLAVYLHDHLGGAQIALEMLRIMRDQHEDEHFRQFAQGLLPEIEADDATLREISEKVASGVSELKQAGGWLLEKAVRLKLGHSKSADFGMFESLEFLALGILGKHSLWRALSVASAQDERLREYDFEEFGRRALRQHAGVEEERLKLAATVFAVAH